MPALHVMTFNVQMLPWLGTAIEGITNNAPETARRVAKAIFARAPENRPHVIAFNEVFDEDGRAELKTQFYSDYPYLIEKVDSGGLLEDSGLMLVSKYPFLQLPNGRDRIEHFYANGEGDDGFANKGVCLVQINTPTDLTTIVFTHLQAAYDAEDQYDDVRLTQLDVVNNSITEAFRGDDGPHGQVMVMGDLNIRGDSGAVSGEWASVFDQMRTKLTEHYFDGWRAYMHPPGVNDLPDQGVSNVDFVHPDTRQRLDYMCFVRETANVDIKLVPQHMYLKLKNQSDHFALEAIVQSQSPHCTPSDAWDFFSAPEVTPFQPGQPTVVRRQQVRFKHPGSYQWIYCKQPGTYTFWTTANATVELYLQSDLSHNVKRLDRLDFHLLPGQVANAFQRFTGDPRGETFVVREPFFILVKARLDATGTADVLLMEHRGESKETAIALILRQEVFSSFPANQTLGSDDLCWFRAIMPHSLSQTARTETFLIDNPSGGDIKASLINPSGIELNAVSGSDPELNLQFDLKGGDEIFLTLQRSDQSLIGMGVTWISPLNFLDLDEPIYVYINDESGPDWAGADEPEMTINVDGVSVFSDSWDDADSGERWPGLWEAIRDSVNAILPGETKVGFMGDITLGYYEPDIGAAGSQAEICPGIGVSEKDIVQRTINLPVPDSVSSGRYSFSCVLRRFP